MELNPNHPVTAAVREQMHVLLALLVAKAGGHALITMEDMRNIQSGSGVSICELEDGLHLTLVSPEEALRLAKREGGLPV